MSKQDTIKLELTLEELNVLDLAVSFYHAAQKENYFQRKDDDLSLMTGIAGIIEALHKIEDKIKDADKDNRRSTWYIKD